MVNSTDKDIADAVFKASNIKTKYKTKQEPKIIYRNGVLKDNLLKGWVTIITPPRIRAVIANLITVTTMGDKLFIIKLPSANDPAISAEKHNIARWPLSSWVI